MSLLDHRSVLQLLLLLRYPDTLLILTAEFPDAVRLVLVMLTHLLQGGHQTFAFLPHSGGLLDCLPIHLGLGLVNPLDNIKATFLHYFFSCLDCDRISITRSYLFLASSKVLFCFSFSISKNLILLLMLLS